MELYDGAQDRINNCIHSGVWVFLYSCIVLREREGGAVRGARQGVLFHRRHITIYCVSHTLREAEQRRKSEGGKQTE